MSKYELKKRIDKRSKEFKLDRAHRWRDTKLMIVGWVIVMIGILFSGYVDTWNMGTYFLMLLWYMIFMFTVSVIRRERNILIRFDNFMFSLMCGSLTIIQGLIYLFPVAKLLLNIIFWTIFFCGLTYMLISYRLIMTKVKAEWMRSERDMWKLAYFEIGKMITKEHKKLKRRPQK